MNRRDFLAMAAATGGMAAFPGIARAQVPGVTATEIRIGQTTALSGPAAAYAAAAIVFKNYLQMINERGGINGRKLTVLQLDDGYSPPKTVEATRKLVEQEEVLLMAATTGTPTSLSVRAYLNQKKVPQLFVGSGAATWTDEIQKYPWSLGFQPQFTDEGRGTAAFVLKQKPNAKIAVCYQNDDAGRDFLRGLKAGLAAASASNKLVSELTHEVTDPTVDSQVISAQASGADVFMLWGSPKATAQGIRKAGEIGWKPSIFINQNATSVKSVMEVAGLDRSKGVMAAAFMKDPADPAWSSDKAMLDWKAFMDKYSPAQPRDNLATYGTLQAQA
ncbi:MAG TPA: ABC transporter substrate-binding protein, partial [Quisquiliibacterium sp.]|nr:ABC transporter substrate-binding protein [Quisquiliibacterium sp.]